MKTTFTHLSFAHVYRGEITKEGFLKKDWSYKRNFGKSSIPLKNNLLLLIFMNPIFNFFTVCEIMDP
jgi:hypothetical protein